MIPEKILNLLGLANRAGKLEIGRYATFDAMKHKRARLIIVAEDASLKIYQMIDELNKKITILKFSDKEKLGKFLGRKEVSVVCICDKHFASAICDLIHQTDNEQ